MDMLSPGAETSERANIYDSTPTDFFHLPCSFLAAEERSLQVHVVDKVPILFGDVERIDARKPCRIIYKAVQ